MVSNESYENTSGNQDKVPCIFRVGCRRSVLFDLSIGKDLWYLLRTTTGKLQSQAGCFVSTPDDLAANFTEIYRLRIIGCSLMSLDHIKADVVDTIRSGVRRFWNLL